jgi:acetyl-CoA carboxylase biotin carboxyl carrier protein
LIINVEQLKQILDLVREHDLSELEIEQEGLRVKVRKDLVGGFVVHPAGGTASHGAAHAAAAGAPAVTTTLTPGAATTASAISGTSTGSTGSTGSISSPGDLESDIELAVVKSPIVGTFYRSPEPGSAAFVDIGTTVKKGQVLCIIEAMKLMNEIDSEYDGEVVNVYVESGQPVQYGERLFAIRTR